LNKHVIKSTLHRKNLEVETLRRQTAARRVDETAAAAAAARLTQAAEQRKVGSITLASFNHYLPCLCYQTLTHYSFCFSFT
jgi:hypothetical protein